MTARSYFEGKKVLGPSWRLIAGQPGIAYLSQYFELRLNVNMEEVLYSADKLEEGKAEQLFKWCRIDHLLNRQSHQLSGGEKQRIALARLLLTAPRLLILDEPFSNLDLIHKSILKEVLEKISTEMGISLIIASHDPTDILPWADKLMLMKDGEVLQADTPEKVYAKPVSEYAGGLLGSYNVLDKNISSKFGITEMPDNKKAFVRPEWFTISGKGIPGKVIRTSYHGHFYESMIDCEGVLLKINTGNMPIEKDADIHLQLKTGSEVVFV
ncbi:MAG: ATP-binding cassette domain-containing protein [Niabella sp.]